MLRQIVDLAFFDADARIEYRTNAESVVYRFLRFRGPETSVVFIRRVPFPLLSVPSLTPFSFMTILARRASEIHLNSFRFTSSFRFFCQIFTDLEFFTQRRPRNRRFHFPSLRLHVSFIFFSALSLSYHFKRKLTKCVSIHCIILNAFISIFRFSRSLLRI